MASERIGVAFKGPDEEDHGVPVGDLRKTFDHLQRALWLMVSHLEGATTETGRAPAWVKRGAILRLTGTSQGSLVAQVSISPLTGYRSSVEDSTQEAIDRIMRWDPEEADSLPESVARELSSIGRDLSREVAYVRLSNPDNHRQVDIPRKERGPEVQPKAPGDVVAPVSGAVLHGRLQEVDWDQRTARLDRYRDRSVRLRFDASLDEDMHRFARQHVEVRGRGRFDSKDRWASVDVEEISGGGLTGEPFDLEAFWRNPDPKVFDPDKVVRATEPFDVDEFMRFIRSIREDRNA